VADEDPGSFADVLEDALGGAGGGGDSGGSSGGGSSAPADPFHTDPVKARKLSEFQSVYTSLWGEPATEEYLKHAILAGANRWEFEDHERKKPAFRKTKTYRDQGSSLAGLVEQLGAL